MVRCCISNGALLQFNESFKSGLSGAYLIPYEEFYVPEVREKVDLRKDFVSWLHASGSTVLDCIFLLIKLQLCKLTVN